MIEMDDVREVLTGVIRRRRNMSKKLVFFDLECSSADNEIKEQSDSSPAGVQQEGTTPVVAVTVAGLSSGCIVQLVCEWTDTEVPKTIVAGLQVEVRGEWDARGRFSVHPDQLTVVLDQRGDCAWENANIAKTFRQQHQPLLRPEDWTKRTTQRNLEKIEKKRVAEELYASQQREGGGESSTGDGHDAAASLHSPHGLMDKTKHNLVFTRWLVHTFGLSRLRGGGSSGCGVCDIAGGRGLVALELTLTHDIPSVLIEPKPFNPNSSYRKRIKKWQNKVGQQLISGVAITPPVHSHSHIVATTPPSPSECECECECECGVSSAAPSSVIHVDLEAQDEPSSDTPTPVVPNTAPVPVSVPVSIPLPVTHLQEEFHGITTSPSPPGTTTTSSSNNNSPAVLRAVTHCGVLLAMHPDQATGAVLETALALHKPFAIVPCCVFSRLFPHRRTPSGDAVCSYEELCDWIQAQSADIRRDVLPFHGRNVVLYRL
jgi:hypothetical protein